MGGHYPSLFYQISSLNAAVGLTVIPPGTVAVRLCPSGANILWRDDGGTPTSTVGFLLKDGESLYYDLGGLPNLKFIKVSGSPILNVQCYRSTKCFNGNATAALTTDAATCVGAGTIA